MDYKRLTTFEKLTGNVKRKLMNRLAAVEAEAREIRTLLDKSTMEVTHDNRNNRIISPINNP